MKVRICPKCGCVYNDGRAECADCGVFTRAAAESEIHAFEDTASYETERQYAHYAGDHPKKWQYAGAAALPIYALVMDLVFGGMFRLLLIVDIIIGAALIIPALKSPNLLSDFIFNRFENRREFAYYYIGRMLMLAAAVILNGVFTLVLLV